MLLPHSATVIHGMAIVRKVNGNKKTLRAISNTVLAIALAEAEGSVRIDIVFDVYKDVSIENEGAAASSLGSAVSRRVEGRAIDTALGQCFIPNSSH